MAFQSLYGILGVLPTATAGEIKDAYRRQAMHWHPDRNPDNKAEAEARFKEIGYAYKVLSDPDARTAYDSELNSRQSQSQSSNTSFDESARPHNSTREDADAVFYEEMLDLAFELSRRGFGPAKILKMLLALDCPEGIARAVAKRLEELGAQGAKAKPRRQPLSDIRNASWEEARRYYEAAIGGIYANTKVVGKDPSKLAAAGIYLISIFGTFFLGFWLFPTNGGFVAKFGWIFGGVIGHLWVTSSASRMIAMNRNATTHYLMLFESFHKGIPPPAKSLFGKSVFAASYIAGAFTWLAYRKMPIFAIVMFCSTLMVGAIVIAAEVPERLQLYFVGVPLAAIMAISHGRIYFWKTTREINKWVSLEQDAAMARLRVRGGVNQWSWAVLFSLMMSLVIFSVQSGSSEAEEARVAAEQHQQAEAAANSKAAAEAAAATDQNEQMRRLQVVVSELEARYPELNVKDPRFNQELTDEVLARQKAYIDRGLDPVLALTTGVSDMEREAATRSGNR